MPGVAAFRLGALVALVLSGLLLRAGLNAAAAQDSIVMVPLILGGNNQPPMNRPPSATNDTYQTRRDVPLIEPAPGVLANDTDPDGDPLRAEVVSSPTHGTLTLNDNGGFAYTPSPGYAGQDAFVYRTSDGQAFSGPATVTVMVSAVNSPPVAASDSYVVEPDTPRVVGPGEGVLANDSDADGDALQATLVTGPARGTLLLNPDGSFTYTPEPGFTGPDSFVYRAGDGVDVSADATVTLTVSSTAQPPLAVADSYRTAPATPLVVGAAEGVLANDSDSNGDALLAELISGAGQGTLALNPDGAFSYSPNTGFIGQDSFTYRAGDGALLSDPATVTISVGVNTPPRIVSGQMAFNKRVIDDRVNQTHDVIAADLDGDDDIDLAATDYFNHAVYWYRNDNGNYAKQVLDGNLEGAYPLHLGDVDGDGDPDVLSGGYQGDLFVWYQNSGGGSFVRRVIDSRTNGPHSIVTGDVDRDGDVDLVTSSQDAGTIAWYANDGTNNFRRAIIDKTAKGAKRADLADMDGDGDIDIVSASFDAHQIAWHENNGNQVFTTHVIDAQARGAYYATPADMDGDGDNDILAAIRRGSTIAWYRNDGGGIFVKQPLDIAAHGARTAIAVDLDKDGDLDAIATARDTDTIAWYENQGGGAFRRRLVDDTAIGPYGLFATDLDFDGDVDIVSASATSDTVAIHRQMRAHVARLAPGATLVLDGTRLRTVDAESAPARLTYSVLELPRNGELRLHSVALAAGGTFTQADVDSGRLSYVQVAPGATGDRFTFDVRDGGENGVRPATGSFAILVEPAVGLSAPN